MITLKVKILQSYWSKSKGLIGADPAYPVYFTTRWGIHTFGMKSAIDVVILDNNNRVVKLVHSLSPNHIFFWNPKYFRVLELPEGTIGKIGINLEDQILIS
jgi:uncharacterized membrane protein (UPF0127 family)